MKSRDVTSEEKRLWREATKRDKKFRAETKVEIDPPPPAKKSAPAVPMKPSPPAPQKKPAIPPRTLSAREAKKQLKAYPKVEATLDLHGMTRTEAFVAVLAFVTAAQGKGKRHLLIVTGKGPGGTGVLKTVLPGWLAEPPLSNAVIAMATAAAEKGGSGALHVIVRKK